MRRLIGIALSASLLMACAALSVAQDRARIADASHSSSVSTVATTTAALDPAYIPHGAKVYVNYIQGMNGFENYLVAAFKKKKVDLLVVADRAQADFEITGYAEHQRAGWAKIIFGSGLPESEASIQVVNLKTSVVSYAVGSYKVDALNGKKSTAEHLAKNLRQKMERDDKRLNK
jgi:3D (Asp-Asp-Asp) domain-containing protein